MCSTGVVRSPKVGVRSSENLSLQTPSPTGQQENTAQAAQKGQTSHQSNPGGMSLPCPESAKTASSPQDALYPMQGLSNSLYLSLGERPRLPFTARIERALFHRARSASKKGTWPFPSRWRAFSASCLRCSCKILKVMLDGDCVRHPMDERGENRWRKTRRSRRRRKLRR